MTSVYKLFSVAVEVLVPIAFAAFVLLKGSMHFPSWAKVLGVGAAIVGLASAALRLSLPYYRELGLTANDYAVGMRFSRTLGGVFVGIVISVLIACARRKSREPASLFGTWRLISYEARGPDGRVQYPMGEDVSGLLIYDAGGNMSAHVTRNDRSFFTAQDPARATDAEVRAAFNDYGSYFGTYTIDQTKQTITHHVRGAWYPNWIGHDQIRYFKFDGNRLLLSTPSMMWDGQSLEHVLTWERIT